MVLAVRSTLVSGRHGAACKECLKKDKAQYFQHRLLEEGKTWYLQQVTLGEVHCSFSKKYLMKWKTWYFEQGILHEGDAMVMRLV